MSDSTSGKVNWATVIINIVIAVATIIAKALGAI